MNRCRALSVAIAVALGIDAAHAATITVNDGSDAGTTTTCTLRQAIVSVNNHGNPASDCVSGSGSDTIDFAAPLANATITLSQGQLQLTASLTISGSGQTIDANLASRAMYLSGAAALMASNLTITRGSAVAGGALYMQPSTGADLSNVTLTNNSAGNGGAIAALSTNAGLSNVTLSHCTVSGNHASHDGGAIDMLRTPTGDTPMLSISDTVISGNTAGIGSTDYGGAIYARSSIVQLTNTTVSGNSAGVGGGVAGIFTGFRILASTFSSNSAAYGSTAILAGTSGLNMANSTITGNLSGTTISISNDVADIVNSTIAGNSVGGVDAAISFSGSVIDVSSYLYNNIIANSGGGDCATGSIPVIAANNLLLTSGCGIVNGANGNIVGSDPQLVALTNNGGPTQSMALGPLSPALNAGSLTRAQYITVTTSVPLDYDQRGPGFLRSLDGMVDIGAFQHQGDRIFADEFEPTP
jgi:predicted outer membrane repeat protein